MSKQREIKFRAWDVDNDEWFYFDFPNGFVLGFSEGRFENWCEYTGFKDKNGKEIYKGDVVKEYEVVWDILNGGWALRRKPRKQDFPAREDGFVYYGYKFRDSEQELEVIGNIYENPELKCTS